MRTTDVKPSTLDTEERQKVINSRWFIRNSSLAFPVIPLYVANSIVRKNCAVKMSGIQVTMPLQMMCRLMVASQVGENVTLPLKWKPATVEINNSPVLPSSYVAFPEFGFGYKLSANSAAPDEAREMCLKDNGQLAVIDSRDKVVKIINRFSSAEMIWVGLAQFHNTKKWITIDGKSTDKLPWASGEPNGDHTCGALSRSRDGLRNMPCGNTYPYLCEIALARN